MSDLLAEVDEVMRQERLEKFWHDHKHWIIGAIASVILATAAWSGFKAWNNSVKTRQTAQLMALLDSPEFPDNVKEAELDMRGGLRGIALVNAAGAYAQSGDIQQAAALYEKVSDDSSIPSDMRGLATVMFVRMKADAQENITEDLRRDLQARLQRVWNDKTNPWRYHAHLQAAVLYGEEGGDFKKARDHLNAVLNAQNLPDSLTSRARALDHVYELREKVREGGQS